MSQDSKILERSVFHAGQVFILAGSKHSNAYIVQSGEVIGFVSHNSKKLEVSRFGPGSLIAETSLLVEEPMTVSYEAVVDTTVVMISAQDFQKSLLKADPLTKTVLKHIAGKFQKITADAIAEAQKNAVIDEEAYKIVQHLIRNLNTEKKSDYEEAMLPHFNELMRVLRSVQERHRHEQQRKTLEKKQSELQGKSDNSTAVVEDIDTFSASVKDN
jgi:CRP-like cAMP-binding protein